MQGLRVYEQSGSRFFSSPVEVVFNFHPHVSFFPFDEISVDGYLEWEAHGWFWEICLPREYYSICWLITDGKSSRDTSRTCPPFKQGSSFFLLDF